MDRLARIAEKVATGVRKKADYGDTMMYINAFDFFTGFMDSKVDDKLDEVLIEAVQDAVLAESGDTQKRVGARLRRNAELKKVMEANSVRFK